MMDFGPHTVVTDGPQKGIVFERKADAAAFLELHARANQALRWQIFENYKNAYDGSKLAVYVDEPSPPRFFFDGGPYGDVYMIPSDRRAEWDAYTVAVENTADHVPVPDFAVAVEQLSHLEFEAPHDVGKALRRAA